MTAERWEKIKNIFDSALDCDSPEERDSYLEKACAEEEKLREEVERLLAQFERVGDFLDTPVLPPVQALESGTVICERYRITQLLGRGGMGEVYQAYDELSKEPIALKTVRDELSRDEKALRRFRKEIRLAGKVAHPNVCRVLDFGIHEVPGAERHSLPFFTMQLVAGDTLSHAIRRDGRFSAGRAFPLIAQMADALQAVHDAGIVHRDFKSGNVILSGSLAVVTDFGLARADAGASALSVGTVTTAAHPMGTVAYMSPEQLTGGKLTAASDIYSLGVVLYEMATGRLPFDDRHVVNAAVERLKGETPAARVFAPDVDPRWDYAIGKCLQTDPAGRFRTASEVAALFRAESWKAPRPAWTRREWGRVAAVGAVPLVGGGGVWFWKSRPYEPKPEALGWYEQGVSALHSMTYEKARKALKKAVEIDPNFAMAHAQLACAYSGLDLSERSQLAIRSAQSAERSHRVSSRDRVRIDAIARTLNGEMDQAAPLYRRLEEISEFREMPAVFVESAWFAEKRNDYAEAERNCKRALALHPTLAGAALRLALLDSRANRQNDAFRNVAIAQASFRAASDSEGLTETLFAEAFMLSKLNRHSEAEPLIEQASGGAMKVEDFHHFVRLQLLLALVYLRQGKLDRASGVASSAVQMAIEHKMENTAAVGLVDLGSGYFLQGRRLDAERLFYQGLAMARKNKSQFTEARALLALGSLKVQGSEPASALEFIGQSLPYFRAGAYRKEIAQALILTGGARRDLGLLGQSESILREAIPAADETRDDDQSYLARAYLSETLEKKGDFPQAITVGNDAIERGKSVRGGLRLVSGLLRVARLYWQLGDYDTARASLEMAAKTIRQLPSGQARLEARVKLCEAEIAYDLGQWAEVAQHLRGAGDLGLDWWQSEATMLSGLALLQSKGADSGLAVCLQVIREDDASNRKSDSAARRLALAHALYSRGRIAGAQKFSKESLEFFAPQGAWEQIWRCRRMLGTESKADSDTLVAARLAIENLKQSWPRVAFESYCGRAPIKQLVKSWL